MDSDSSDTVTMRTVMDESCLFEPHQKTCLNDDILFSSPLDAINGKDVRDTAKEKGAECSQDESQCNDEDKRCDDINDSSGDTVDGFEQKEHMLPVDVGSSSVPSDEDNNEKDAASIDDCTKVIPSGQVESASRLASLISLVQGKVSNQPSDEDDSTSESESSDASASEESDDSEEEEEEEQSATDEEEGEELQQSVIDDILCENEGDIAQSRDGGNDDIVLDSEKQSSVESVEDRVKQGDQPAVEDSTTSDSRGKCSEESETRCPAEDISGTKDDDVECIVLECDGITLDKKDHENDKNSSTNDENGSTDILSDLTVPLIGEEKDSTCQADSDVTSHSQLPVFPAIAAVTDAIVIDTDDETEVAHSPPKLSAMPQAGPSASVVQPPISDSAYSIFERPGPASRKRVAAFMSRDLDKYLNTQSELNVSFPHNEGIEGSEKNVKGRMEFSEDEKLETVTEPNVDNVDGITFLSYDSRKSMLADAVKKSKQKPENGSKNNSDPIEKSEPARKLQFPADVELDPRLFREVDASALGLKLSSACLPDPQEGSTTTRKVGKIYGRKSNGKFASKVLVLNKRGPRSHSVGTAGAKKVNQQTSAATLRPPLEPLYITEQMALSAVCALKRLNCDKPGCLYGCICYMCGPSTPSPPPPLPTPPVTPNCNKEYCRLGCICDSLSGATSGQRREPMLSSGLSSLHCGRVECMFGCVCSSVTEGGVRKSVRLRDKPRLSGLQHVKELVFFDPTVMLADDREQHKSRYRPKLKRNKPKKSTNVKLRVVPPGGGDNGSSPADDAVKIEISSDESSSSCSKLSNCSKTCLPDDSSVPSPVLTASPPMEPGQLSTVQPSSAGLRTQMVVLERHKLGKADSTSDVTDTSGKKQVPHLLQIESDCEWEVHRLRVLGLLAALADMQTSQQTVPECVSICGLDVRVLPCASKPTQIPARLYNVLRTRSMYAIRIRIMAQQPPQLSMLTHPSISLLPPNPPELVVVNTKKPTSSVVSKSVSPVLSSSFKPQQSLLKSSQQQPQQQQQQQQQQQRSNLPADTAIGISAFNGITLQASNTYIPAAQNAVHIALQGGGTVGTPRLTGVPAIPKPAVSQLMQHLIAGTQLPEDAVFPLAMVKNTADMAGGSVPTPIEIRPDYTMECNGTGNTLDADVFSLQDENYKPWEKGPATPSPPFPPPPPPPLPPKHGSVTNKKRKSKKSKKKKKVESSLNTEIQKSQSSDNAVKQEVNYSTNSHGSMAGFLDWSTVKRSEAHNSLERARRTALAGNFNDLADVVDVVRVRRGHTPKVVILTKAQQRIRDLQSTDEKLRADLQKVTSQNKSLKRELMMLRAEAMKFNSEVAQIAPIAITPALDNPQTQKSLLAQRTDQTVYIVDSDSEGANSPHSPICEDTCDSIIDLCDL